MMHFTSGAPTGLLMSRQEVDWVCCVIVSSGSSRMESFSAAYASKRLQFVAVARLLSTKRSEPL